MSPRYLIFLLLTHELAPLKPYWRPGTIYKFSEVAGVSKHEENVAKMAQADRLEGCLIEGKGAMIMSATICEHGP